MTSDWSTEAKHLPPLWVCRERQCDQGWLDLSWLNQERRRLLLRFLSACPPIAYTWKQKLGKTKRYRVSDVETKSIRFDFEFNTSTSSRQRTELYCRKAGAREERHQGIRLWAKKGEKKYSEAFDDVVHDKCWMLKDIRSHQPNNHSGTKTEQGYENWLFAF